MFGLGLDVEELLGAYPPIHRQVARRGPQVLRDRDDVGAGVVQVVQRLADLGPILAHAQNEIGLGDESVGVCLCQDIQGTLVPEGGANALEDAGNRLDVVGKDLRPGIEDHTQ